MRASGDFGQSNLGRSAGSGQMAGHEDSGQSQIRIACSDSGSRHVSQSGYASIKASDCPLDDHHQLRSPASNYLPRTNPTTYSTVSASIPQSKCIPRSLLSSSPSSPSPPPSLPAATELARTPPKSPSSTLPTPVTAAPKAPSLPPPLPTRP